MDKGVLPGVLTRVIMLFLSNGHSPQIHETRSLLVRMCRGESHFFKNGECQQVWRVRANQDGECRRVWRVLAKPFDECWHKKDRSFYAQITYCICIKRSSLHLLNSPNSQNLPNSPNSHKTCLSRVWRVLAKWFGECRRVRRVWANQVGKCWRI